MRPNLPSWQWSTYGGNHASRLNLWIHLVAVPMFAGSLVGSILALVTGQWVAAAGVFFAAIAAFAAQAIGHKREAVAPIPFDGPLDAFSRILLEQFFTFPRFVLSGGFWRAMSAGKSS